MGEKKVIKAALLGAGTVGSGVYALSEMLKDEMFQKTGANLEIKKVLVRNTKKERPGIPKEVLTDNWKEILEDDEFCGRISSDHFALLLKYNCWEHLDKRMQNFVKKLNCWRKAKTDIPYKIDFVFGVCLIEKMLLLTFIKNLI